MVVMLFPEVLGAPSPKFSWHFWRERLVKICYKISWLLILSGSLVPSRLKLQLTAIKSILVRVTFFLLFFTFPIFLVCLQILHITICTTYTSYKMILICIPGTLTDTKLTHFKEYVYLVFFCWNLYIQIWQMKYKHCKREMFN